MQKYGENVFSNKAILMKEILWGFPIPTQYLTTQTRFASLAVFIRFHKTGNYTKERKGEGFP